MREKRAALSAQAFASDSPMQPEPVPTSSDTCDLGSSDFGRAPTNEYMRRIAITSEALSYDGLLSPTGVSCHVPWVTAASLIAVKSRIKLRVALGTSASDPTAFARQAATLDQALGGRLLINVVPGGRHMGTHRRGCVFQS